MSRTNHFISAMLAVALGATAAQARATEPSHEDVARAAAKALGIQAKIDSIVPSEDLKGFLEVRIGSQLLYFSTDGQKLIDGQVIEVSTKKNLTQQRLNAALSIDFDKLPLSDGLITYKEGTGKHRIALFADPNCGFCKRFEPILGEMKDVTVYTFIIPVLGPRSDDLSKRILCAPQPAASWRDWMTKGVEPPVAPSCSLEQLAPLTRNKAFAAAHSINSTPTTFIEPRTRLPGAMTAEQLRSALSAAQIAAPAALQAQQGKTKPLSTAVADRR